MPLNGMLSDTCTDDPQNTSRNTTASTPNPPVKIFRIATVLT
jgi:hypothetical protein